MKLKTPVEVINIVQQWCTLP